MELNTIRAIREDRLDKVLKLLRVLRFPICAVMHAVTTPMRILSPLKILLALSGLSQKDEPIYSFRKSIALPLEYLQGDLFLPLARSPSFKRFSPPGGLSADW